MLGHGYVQARAMPIMICSAQPHVNVAMQLLGESRLASIKLRVHTAELMPVWTHRCRSSPHKEKAVRENEEKRKPTELKPAAFTTRKLQI